MTVVATDQIGTPIGIYDENDGCASLTTLHAVDVTAACGGDPEKRKLLKFTRTRSDVIVLLVECYYGRNDLGMSVHYLIDEADLRGSGQHMKGLPNFRSFAKSFGLSVDSLASLVTTHATAVPRPAAKQRIPRAKRVSDASAIKTLR